jgi:hypothetical protein
MSIFDVVAGIGLGHASDNYRSEIEDRDDSEGRIDNWFDRDAEPEVDEEKVYKEKVKRDVEEINRVFNLNIKIKE